MLLLEPIEETAFLEIHSIPPPPHSVSCLPKGRWSRSHDQESNSTWNG